MLTWKVSSCGAGSHRNFPTRVFSSSAATTWAGSERTIGLVISAHLFRYLNMEGVFLRGGLPSQLSHAGFLQQRRDHMGGIGANDWTSHQCASFPLS